MHNLTLLLTVDSYRKLSAFAITQLQKLNIPVDTMQGDPISVRIARGLSRRGLLDLTRFLDESDVTSIQGQLEIDNNKNIIGAINGKAHKLSEPEGSYQRSYKAIEISQASAEVLKKYFGSANIGILQDHVTSVANPGYMNEVGTIVIGAPDLNARFTSSGFPMYQRDPAFHSPYGDVRLNFNFTNDPSIIIDQSKRLASLTTYAQLHGVPITSKVTTADDQVAFAGRIVMGLLSIRNETVPPIGH